MNLQKNRPRPRWQKLHKPEELTRRILTLLLIATPVTAIASPEKSDTPTIRIGFPHFPPYSISQAVHIPAGKNKHCSYETYTGHGIDVDFLVRVLEEAGLQYQLSFVPQARLAKGLDNIGLDATASVFYSEIDGQPRYQYILYDIGGSTIFLAEKTIALSMDSLTAIKEARLGTVRGEYFHDEDIHEWVRKKPNSNVMIANDYEHLFSMLSSQRVDVIATNDVLGQYMLKQIEADEIAITPYKVPYGMNPKSDGIYIALSKRLMPAHASKIRLATKTLLKRNELACIKQIYGADATSKSELVVRLTKEMESITPDP